MSDSKSEPISAETGTVGAGPAAPDMVAPSAPVTAPRPRSSLRMLAPEQEETSPKADAPKTKPSRLKPARSRRPRLKRRRSKRRRSRPLKPEAPRLPGKLMIMSPGERVWNDAAQVRRRKPRRAGDRPASAGSSAMAAVVALATVAGALGGALATAGLGHLAGGEPAVVERRRAGSVDRADRCRYRRAESRRRAHLQDRRSSQFNKTSDRLDKVEKAQAEPAAKLAKLSEAVDKLRAAPAAPAAGCRCDAGRGEGSHGIGDAAAAATAAARSGQDRGRQAADGRGLGAA